MKFASAIVSCMRKVAPQLGMIALCCAFFLFGSSRARSEPDKAKASDHAVEYKTILSGKGYTVDTVRARGRYTLLMRNSAGQSSQVSMPATPWNISLVAPAADGKVVVDLPLKDGGGPDFGFNMIFVMGSRPPAVVDRFRTERLSLSPNGRTLAFVSTYPGHFAPDDFTSNFVMLYNLDKSPLENRAKPRTDFPLKDDPDRQVGTQIYPLSRPLVGQGSSHEDVRPIHAAYDFTWSPDSTRLLFIDEEDQSGANDAPEAGGDASRLGNLKMSPRIPPEARDYLVLVEFQKDLAKVRRVRIDKCPQISGISCDFDLRTAVFGRDAVTIIRHVTGRFNKDLATDLRYDSFVSFR